MINFRLSSFLVLSCILGLLPKSLEAKNDPPLLKDTDPLPKEKELPYVTEKDVEEALQASKKKCPAVYEDALRIWKNFKSGKSDPHYTYRFWAYDLILWLRKEKEYSFETLDKVAEVFRILQKKVHLSPDSAVLLTQDVWNHMTYKEGIPDLENWLPQQRKKDQARLPLESPKKEIEA